MNRVWNKIRELLIKQRKIYINDSLFKMQIEYNFVRVLFPILLIIEAILLGLIIGQILYN